MIDELLQLALIGVEIGDRPRRHAATPSPPCATAGAILTIRRGSNGFGIRYSGPKLSVVARRTPRRRCRTARPRPDRRSPRTRGELHLLVDRRRADIERAAENERKAQDVVDLIGKVRAPGRDDRVGPRLLGEVGHDLGLGIGQRQDQRLRPPSASAISGLSTRAAERPRKISAPPMMSASVRALVFCA